MYVVSDAFIEELRQPVIRHRVKMDVLDVDGSPVSGGTFNDTGYSSDATSNLVDGSVDVDVTRPNRRSFTATLMNSFGEWSPSSDWSGLFYVNREIQLYRGVVFEDGESELVPVGRFLIDHADVIVERHMSTVALSGTDRWKKIAKSLAARTKSWASGTGINTVFNDILDTCGIDSGDINLDPLTPRLTGAKTLNQKLIIELGDSHGDLMWKLANDYGLDMYFDPLGVFTTQDMQNPADQDVVYTFIA